MVTLSACRRIDKSLFFGALLFSTVSAESPAQNDQSILKERNLAFKLGYEQLRIRDVQVSPLVQYSNSGLAGFTYCSTTPKQTLEIALEGSAGGFRWKEYPSRTFTYSWPNDSGRAVTDSFTADRDPLFAGRLSLSYLHRIHPAKQKPLSFSLGGTIENAMHLSMNRAVIQNELFLAPSAMVQFRQSEKNSFSGRLSFAAVGVVTRLPWAIDVYQIDQPLFSAFFQHGTQILTLNNYQNIAAEASFRRTLNPLWKLEAGYDFVWMHSRINRGVYLYRNALSLSFIRSVGISKEKTR